MLTIITGPSRSGRDSCFCERVKQAAEDKNVLVIVPDQYSFESDKKLYNVLGAKRFNRIMTAGFNRLAELISKSCGSREFDNAAENSRLIVMYKAVRSFRAERQAQYFKRSLEKGRFISEMIELVSELLRSGITPEDLRIASERLEGSVSRKLFDVSRIYSYYLSGLEGSGLRDSITAVGAACDLARDSGYFNGMTVFIDGFTSFTYDEYRFIDIIMQQAESVTVSLLLSGGSADRSESPFAVTVRTEDRLMRLAADHNIRTENFVCEHYADDSSAVSAIDRSYCGCAVAEGEKKGLTVVSANDLPDELEYVCAEIERLVRSEGHSYKDIAVAARQPETAASAIEGTFERCGIPYFIDRQIKADSAVIVIFLKSLFECVITKEYRTDAILRYIRSPLCPILDIDITSVEEYCIRYSVEGGMWLEPFCAHDSRTHISERLEKLRAQIIEPLNKFKLACTSATAAEICKALFELLREIDVSRQVYSVVKRAAASANETQLELARANKQLWKTVLGAVKSIYDEMGDEPLSLRRFYELFKLMTSRMTISAPPQKLDAVRCINAESSRLDDVRTLFVIEVNDGIFPAQPRSEGLFTEREKQLLSDLELELGSTAMNSVENERLTVYRTLTLPSEKLYVLYSETDGKGKLRAPSQIVRKLGELFPKTEVVHVSELPLIFFCTSYGSAYNKYLEHCKEKLAVIKDPEMINEERLSMIAARRRRADEVASIEAALGESELYASKLAALPTLGDTTDHSITQATAKKLFFEDSLKISATKVSDFYHCPFSFFLEHGLRLRLPQRITLDNLNKGNYLHRCLESVMTVETEQGRAYNNRFCYLTEEQLAEKIHQAFLRYESEEIGGSYGKTASYYAELAEYEKKVLENVKLIQQEFSDSRFVPEHFEYRLGEGGRKLELKLSDELTVTLRGSIDRVDVYTDENGKKYLRITDYKTGDTELRLAELYHGINLQLLIYLLALTENGEGDPAGVQYAHIREFTAELSPDKASDEDVLKQQLSEFKPDGMFVGEQKLIEALNRAYNGAFSVLSFKNDLTISSKGRQPVTEQFIRAAEEFARRKMIALAERLSKGKVPAAPVKFGKYDPCTTCDNYPVCGRALRGDPEEIKSGDKDLFIKEIEEIEKEMKGENTDGRLE